MVERPALEAALLDAGGTLVRLDFEWMAGVLRGLGVAVGPAALRRAEITGRGRYDASRGTRPAPDASPVSLGAGRKGTPAPLGAAGEARAYFEGMLEAGALRIPTHVPITTSDEPCPIQ